MASTQSKLSVAFILTSSLLLFQTACGVADSPQPDPGNDQDPDPVAVSSTDDTSHTQTQSQALGWSHRGKSHRNKSRLDRVVRGLMRVHDVEEPETIEKVDPDVFKLGKKLFFDKALSGNKETACATCHFTTPGASTGDGLPLGIGVGGQGSIPDRTLGPGKEHEPRHSIELFNRGLKGWETQFWDARVQKGPNGELVTPAGKDLLKGLKGVVEAQAMFPVTSRVEMRGDKHDPNPISQVPASQIKKIWSKLMDRILSYKGYRKLFKKAYPNKKIKDLTFADAANAIGRWEREAYTFLDAPFDEYLEGDDSALSKKEKKGAKIFYGKGGCAGCHSGTLTTDQEFHNIAAPQIGPGKGSTKPLDPGRYIVTGRPTHKFEFRTPPLRNVELTPPYMHSGAYETLEAAIEHHLNPKKALENYDGSHLRSDFQKEVNNSKSVQKRLLKSLDWRLRVRAYIQRQKHHPLRLDDKDVDHLVAFLKSMTSPTAKNDLDQTRPTSVPSGLLEDGT